MTEVTDSFVFRHGSFSNTAVRTVVVHDGRRGAKGPKGDDGDQGDQGDSIVSRGPWITGTEYCPLDAVTSQSSVDSSVTNLFIQKSSAACAVSTTLPKDDPSRWDEIGETDFGDTFGNIWEVSQAGHNFSLVGQPVAWDASVNLYVPASIRSESELPVAVIREIIDADNFTLQSSGMIRNIDPVVNLDGATWTDGAIYYQTLNGVVTAVRPTAGYVAAVFRIIDGDAIVFPSVLDEPRTPELAPAASTSHVKVDNVSPSFDGIATTFPLTVSAAAIAWPASTEAFSIYVDGNPQEPLTDFSVVEDAGNAVLQFATPPEDYQSFWGVYAISAAIFPPSAPSGEMWTLTLT